ncbi:hypothetical protein DPMN_060220 [Dreissena polymorpha]|uniref:Uncharacterized protein n=1 Tax=Dreissena polymorpha TaxID=45954 RepID=A0A9D4C4U2_DREPO|nr:hypothetical protein DPMN_060220 [Dreissena polymorpha]
MIQFIETSRETQTSDSWSAANISVRLDHSTVKTRTALKWILSIYAVARKYVFVAGKPTTSRVAVGKRRVNTGDTPFQSTLHLGLIGGSNQRSLDCESGFSRHRHARYSMSCIRMALLETIKQLRQTPAFTVLFCLVAIIVKIMSSGRELNPRPPDW